VENDRFLTCGAIKIDLAGGLELGAQVVDVWRREVLQERVFFSTLPMFVPSLSCKNDVNGFEFKWWRTKDVSVPHLHWLPWAMIQVPHTRLTENGLFLSAFPMFVPSLSWQNDTF
jgi:hypothetical protein